MLTKLNRPYSESLAATLVFLMYVIGQSQLGILLNIELRQSFFLVTL